MSGASETNLDPGEVLDAAARLAVQADSMRASIADPAERIRSLNAAEPWGSDDPGTAFRTAYLGSSGNGGVDTILDGCDGICEAARTLAENVGLSAFETQDQDELLADHLNRSIAGYEGLVDAQSGAIGDVSGRLDEAAAAGGPDPAAPGGSGGSGGSGAASGAVPGAAPDPAPGTDVGGFTALREALAPGGADPLGGRLYRTVGPEDWDGLALAGGDPDGVVAAPDGGDGGAAPDPGGGGDVTGPAGTAAAAGQDGSGPAEPDGQPGSTGEPDGSGSGPSGRAPGGPDGSPAPATGSDEPPDGAAPGATYAVDREDEGTAPDADGGGAGTALSAVDTVS